MRPLDINIEQTPNLKPLKLKATWTVSPTDEMMSEISSNIKEEIEKMITDDIINFIEDEKDNMTKKDQYVKLEKILDRCRRIIVHLDVLGREEESKELSSGMIAEIKDIQRNCITGERKLRKSEMIRINDCWNELSDKYPNLR